MIVDLPYPHRILWPNGRTRSQNYRAAEFKKHFAWARDATLGAGYLARQAVRELSAPIPVTITVYGKSRGRMPDPDNVVSAAKAYIDGIAAKLDIDDRNFDAPQVRFAAERNSRFYIEVGR